MLHLCFAAGLRVSELVGAPLENLSLRRPASILIRGKGRQERSLPLWKETTADLRAWLAVRGPVRASELFVNAEGAPMTRAGFEYVLDKHTRAAAETCRSLAGRSVSPHQLRHYVALGTMSHTFRSGLVSQRKSSGCRHIVLLLPPTRAGEGGDHEVHHQRSGGSVTRVGGTSGALHCFVFSNCPD